MTGALSEEAFRPNSLAGRVAVIAGASRGIGRGIALGLAEAGATVYLLARTLETGQSTRPGTLLEVVAEIERKGGRAIPVVCDLSDEGQIAAATQRVKDAQGRIDILVNSAISAPDADDGPFYAPFGHSRPMCGT
jgi:NAD(P)-dependent dehydrogenase (short-subunit alcohol dehydrogenase family)